jgi:hypothetical protein
MLNAAAVDKLLLRFAMAARNHHEALEAMDTERVEQHARMVAALYGSIMAAGPLGRERFSSLLDHPEPVVAAMTAVYIIREETVRSLAVLQRVAAEPGLLGFRALAAVERWQNGEWD